MIDLSAAKRISGASTATGSVPGERAGMASGIDMSARMISLAVNVAFMGFILVEGVQASLRSVLPGGAGVASLWPLAERIAAGAIIPPEQDVSGAVVHAALIDGFGWVLLYGRIGVWALVGISYAIFGSAKSARALGSAESHVDRA